jgi:hypothetical protein
MSLICFTVNSSKRFAAIRLEQLLHDLQRRVVPSLASRVIRGFFARRANQCIIAICFCALDARLVASIRLVQVHGVAMCAMASFQDSNFVQILRLLAETEMNVAKAVICLACSRMSCAGSTAVKC